MLTNVFRCKQFLLQAKQVDKLLTHFENHGEQGEMLRPNSWISLKVTINYVTPRL